MKLNPEEISGIIKTQIKNYSNKIEQAEVGTVVIVGDGIARVSGLTKCMAGELVEFPNGEFGWDGAAGAMLTASPETGIAFCYVMHVIGCGKGYFEIHPEIRNLVYEAIKG